MVGYGGQVLSQWGRSQAGPGTGRRKAKGGGNRKVGKKNTGKKV